jgi:hypothetical protein
MCVTTHTSCSIIFLVKNKINGRPWEKEIPDLNPGGTCDWLTNYFFLKKAQKKLRCEEENKKEKRGDHTQDGRTASAMCIVWWSLPHPLPRR